MMYPFEEISGKLRKLRRTLALAYCLIMASTFGKYKHSVFDGFNYAIYEWRGRVWAVPRSPFDKEFEP